MIGGLFFDGIVVYRVLDIDKTMLGVGSADKYEKKEQGC